MHGPPPPTSIQAGRLSAKTKYTPALIILLCALAWPALGADERMRWFDEARFGIMFDYGIYAIHGNQWKGKSYTMNSAGRGYSEFLLRDARIPIAEYKELAKQFTASEYDPVALARLAHAAGAGYLILTTKHVEGFTLFPSDASDWNVMNTPAARDLVGPLAAAARSEGLRFGVYYSQSQDWVHPGGAKRNFPWERANKGKKNFDEGDGWEEAHKGSYDDYLKNLSLPQVRELLGRYHPDIFWWDVHTHMSPARVRPFLDAIGAYPNMITNDRLGGGFGGDFRTPEQWVPPEGFSGERFEVCMTINDSWGFVADDHNWKSTQALLHVLSDAASKGGNLLLGVGLKADGAPPGPAAERLRDMGLWLGAYGEAIRGTQASPFPRQLTWGRITRKASADSGETLYLHIWNWPENREIMLPTVTQTPREAVHMPSKARLRASVEAGGLVIKLPADGPRDARMDVIAVRFDRPVTVKMEAYLRADADGVYRIRPEEADRYGSITGVMQLKTEGGITTITDWEDPRWHLRYRIKCDLPCAYNIKAEICARAAACMSVEQGKHKHIASVLPAGKQWQTVDLGEVALPAGESTLVLRPGKEWNPIDMRMLVLSPKDKAMTK